MTLALELQGITKRFPRVVANDNIHLQVKAGSVHAIVGENGAGKSTLMSIVYGVQQPDEGTIKIRGIPVVIDNPAVAIKQGIGMVFQHFMLIPSLSVGENIVLGRESVKGLALDLKSSNARIGQLAEEYQLEIRAEDLVGDLPVGIQQRVEILKVLYRGADILIFDEPTAVLTPQEVEKLFSIMEVLVKSGKTLIFITHKLDEVMAISDRVSVLRGGKLVGEVETVDTNPQKLAQMMVGREVLLRVTKTPAQIGSTVLRVKDLSAIGNHGLPVLKNISFELRHGEILGVAGVEGNGQSELIQVLTGLHPATGEIYLDDQELLRKSVYRVKQAGVGHIPEDRHKRGLVLGFSVADNLVLGSHRRRPFANHGWRHFPSIRSFATEKITEYDIRPPTYEILAGMLSGGNQQKVVIARELSADPQVLIAAQPTRGVDIGAIEFIHRQLLAFRDRGRAVLLFSAELQEILSLSDRIIVMYEGTITGELSAEEATEEKVGLLMAGLGGMGDEK